MFVPVPCFNFCLQPCPPLFPGSPSANHSWTCFSLLRLTLLDCRFVCPFIRQYPLTLSPSPVIPLVTDYFTLTALYDGFLLGAMVWDWLSHWCKLPKKSLGPALPPISNHHLHLCTLQLQPIQNSVNPFASPWRSLYPARKVLSWPKGNLCYSLSEMMDL